VRTTHRCPKCQCPGVWQVDPVLLPNPESSNSNVVMPVVTRSGSGAADKHELRPRRTGGHFEMWICWGCGYTEWYAVGVNETLGALAQASPTSGVRYHNSSGPTEPVNGGEDG
jgi:hypothetical protein